MPDDLVNVLDPVSFVPTGKIVLKSRARKEGWMYPVVHLWIYNSKGEILMQHRCKEKNLYPDKWDISVAGGVNANEVAVDAAVREAYEELGLIIPKKNLTESFVFTENYLYKGLKINELAHVFLYEYNLSADSLKLQKEEVDGVKFFSPSEIEKILAEKNEDYLICANDSFSKVFGLIKSKI